jgi:hypothetical protein
MFIISEDSARCVVKILVGRAKRVVNLEVLGGARDGSIHLKTGVV